MTPKLISDYITSFDANQGKTVAVQLTKGQKDKFYSLSVCRSENPTLPAPVFLYEELGAKTPIWTNLPVDHWLLQNRLGGGRGGLRSLQQAVDYARDHAKEFLFDADVAPKVVEGKVPVLLDFADLQGPAGFSGLHQAALSLAGASSATPLSAVTVEQKVLRYYMLATYALVALCAQKGYRGMERHVGCLVVDDCGKILTAGINLGEYKHAETSALLRYFLANRAQRQLPARTVIFSTLTPCGMCTTYLENARNHDTVVYFGQRDTGPGGSAGERIAKPIGAVIKEPQGRAPPPAQARATPEPDQPSGTASQAAASSIHKVRIAHKLESCCSGLQSGIAQNIGTIAEARDAMAAALAALDSKQAKERPGDTSSDAKRRVLTYLRDWLAGVKIASTA
jgi:tRNA(Arg) A34 adenosine deaminase TadA